MDLLTVLKFLGVKKCAVFEVELGNLNVPIETHDGKDFYVANIDIEMILESASLSFCGVCGDAYGETRSEPKLVQFV